MKSIVLFLNRDCSFIFYFFYYSLIAAITRLLVFFKGLAFKTLLICFTLKDYQLHAILCSTID